MVHVRGLECLGVSSEKYGSLLVPVIISRMPEEIAIKVTRKTTENVWDIKEIMDIIRKEIEARKVSRKIIGQERKKSEKETKQHRRQFLPQATTKSFVTKLETSTKTKMPIRCYFCDKNHYSNECKKVTDVKQRRAILLAAKRCSTVCAWDISQKIVMSKGNVSTALVFTILHFAIKTSKSQDRILQSRHRTSLKRLMFCYKRRQLLRMEGIAATRFLLTSV